MAETVRNGYHEYLGWFIGPLQVNVFFVFSDSDYRKKHTTAEGKLWLPVVFLFIYNMQFIKETLKIMNIWKSYMWTAEWRIIWRKIVAVIYATYAVAKRKPEKIQACTEFELDVDNRWSGKEETRPDPRKWRKSSLQAYELRKSIQGVPKVRSSNLMHFNFWSKLYLYTKFLVFISLSSTRIQNFSNWHAFFVF